MDKEILRVCKKCGKPCSYEELVKDKRKPDGVISVCSKCNYKRNKASGVYARVKDKMRLKYKENPTYHKMMKDKATLYRSSFNERVLLSSAKIRAKKAKLEFDLVEEDIKIPKFCPLTGLELIRGKGKHTDSSPVIDRIDNSKGYIKTNIRVISYLANRMKTNATKEQLIYFADHIKIYLGEDIV